MADEKILKDEALKDDELEEVVGGYYDTWHDYENIKKLEANGKGSFSRGGYSIWSVQDAFRRIGKELGINISSKLYYDKTPGSSPNKYYLDDKEISRDELWDIINAGLDANN